MDGPASYRDGEGQIHELRHNQHVRLNASLTSYQLPFLLPPQNSVSRAGVAATAAAAAAAGGGTYGSSLGERIMAGATNKKAINSPTTSTLASMMQGRTPPQLAAALPQPSYQGLYDQQQDDGYDTTDATAAFSTSLTGLEILQKAGQGQLQPDALFIISSSSSSHKNNDETASSIMPQLPFVVAHDLLQLPPPLGMAHCLHDTNDADEDNHHHDVFELEME